MDIYKDCIKQIKSFCETVEHIPAGESVLINYWIDCLYRWSCDKTRQQVEDVLCVMLGRYTGDRYRYNWDSSQYIIAIEVLKIKGYEDEAEDYYSNYDESDDDFYLFWNNLNIPDNLRVEINHDAMRYFGAYLNLLWNLEEFANFRGINFAECAKRAGYHEDFYTHNRSTDGKNSGITPLNAYIIKDAQKVLNAIDAEFKGCNKPSGKRVALIICALEKYGYIANIDGLVVKIYTAFKWRYNDKIATRQAVTQYINAHRNPNAKTDKPQFTNEELTSFIDKI